MIKSLFLLLLLSATTTGLAQDSVDVTFRWTITGHSGYSVPGEFNGWNSAAWPMQNAGGNLWIRQQRLAVNPGGGGIPGAYQYKYFYSGASPWPNDTLNHRFNGNDNDNSILIVQDPTIYHFVPNQRSGLVDTGFPTISSFLYPKVGSVVDTSSLTLQIDDTTLTRLGAYYDFGTEQFAYPVPFELDDGGHVSILSVGAVADTVTFTISTGGPPVAPIPPYARHGVTLPSAASNDSTTFRLRVGGTNLVLLRVAPLGEPVMTQPARFMRQNPGGINWWINLDLPEGEYEYLYQTGDGTVLFDPWGRETGTYGTRFSTGSSGLTADDYVWTSDGFQRPPIDRLCIYELHVGEFAGGYYNLGGGEAGFSDLASLMAYFDSLGVNAIELMPINDFGLIGPSGHSWGYDISHYFALEPSYGRPADLKALVDSAHARGIAVLLDVVFNHQNDPGPLWQMEPDEIGNLYFKPASTLHHNEDPLFFFRDMDHWTNETQELVYETIKMWIDEYRIDGFRYDFTQGVGWDIAEPTRGILGWANAIDQEYNGEIYQIAEHLPESAALILHSGLTGGWHDSYHDEIFDEARFRNTSLTNFESLILDLDGYPGNDIPAAPTRYANRTEPVNMNNNHDEQSLIYEMITFQGVDTATAYVRDKLYSTFMFTSLGIPLVWQGMEFGAPRGWMTDNEKLSYRPVEWDLFDTDRGRDHFGYYRKLIFQRLNNPALYRGTLNTLWRFESEKVLVWGFTDAGSGNMVMAVANLSSIERTVNDVPWLGSGIWYNIWDQSELVSPGVSLDSLTLPAYTALVYSNVPDSVLTSVSGQAAGVPEEFALHQNYPNPFNPTTTITFDLPAEAPVTISVYDLLGRKVADLLYGSLPPGTHAVVWDGRSVNGSHAAAGVYLVRMTAQGAFASTRK
ncbi:MAG: alpha-amylase family glycosyl hydrolase, partial [Ignavibacteria bacterium]|nr:alpha-amylase family glycosyl hydrolase [Ignavibacteria bacterium]